ncbi:MAG: hypothetical protein VZQ51_10400 [Bacteroidales bacterium]|nr:hypothetical protein [Bacteroidales bacterium]
MKKIILILVLAVTSTIVSAQNFSQELIDVTYNFKQKITELANDIKNANSSQEREAITDSIEKEFENFDNYLNKEMRKNAQRDTYSCSEISNSKSMAFSKTPTTFKIIIDDFRFSGTPVTYSYTDNDITIRTTPTTFKLQAGEIEYTSTPTSEKLKKEYRSEKDTLKIHKNLYNTISIVTNSDNDNDIDIDNPHNNNIRSAKYFYFGINNFINSNGKVDQPDADFMALNSGRSIEAGLCLGLHRWELAQNFALDIALDYRLNHYSFQNTFNLIKQNDMITANYDNLPVKEFKRHNLRLQYLSIPLQFELELGYSNPCRLRAGIEGSIRIGSREKQVYKTDGHRQVERIRSDFETNFLRYAFTFGLGFKNLELYGNYSPVQLFKNGHGPELYPISMGIRFVM